MPSSVRTRLYSSPYHLPQCKPHTPLAPPASSWQERAKPDWPMPTVQNVVATADLGCRLNLQTIAQHARNVEYNRRKFHALVMRIREPRTTTLVFASGRMVVTGAKSESLARLAARRHARAIQKCGYQSVKFVNFKVQNFVGSVTCGFLVRLERISHKYWQSARHEPELFPGLVYTMVKPSLKCLVFTTGKVVLTGAKKKEDVFEAFLNLYPLLLEAKVEGSTVSKPNEKTSLALKGGKPR
ncbi:transcription factor TFIID-domain-containing protein [Corynascus novoguineensis]|uniref:Transcription factor TFIID-domain-containing protein n=1 Tax=Corynascus novoguineensis TaxID=1126955 RepID=A0AAN7CZY6_9PEZI|nr:transcription factor TFIID-domain-containing protein [Corynascus novoguineensis]